MGVAGLLGCAAEPVWSAGKPEDEAGYRRSFDVDPKQLGTVGDNPYFPLTPGLRISGMQPASAWSATTTCAW